MKKLFIIFFLVFCLFIPCELWAQEGGLCGTYSSSAIVAAFNTQGYWALDDMVYQMDSNNLAGWAPLIYIFVILGGLIMVAMGMPPKNYMWWVFGPVLFNFLLFTPHSQGCKGVGWQIGTNPSSGVAGIDEMSQAKVWQFAEVGWVNQNRGRAGDVTYSNTTGPSQNATNLPWFFITFDYVISEQIGFLVDWSGIGNQEDHEGIDVLKPDNNAPKVTWSLMNNLKWPMLEDISGAELHNADIKEGLSRFLTSECGNIIADFVDKGNFISSASSRGKKFPEFVLKDEVDDKVRLVQALEKRWVPYPEEIRRLLRDEEFRNFRPVRSFAAQNDNVNYINCMQYIYIIVQGFRWESGFIFNNAVSRAGIPSRYVVYSFLYGWDFGDDTLDSPRQIKFIQNLILVHLFRNELFKTYFPVDRQFSSSERSENYVKANAGKVGSKNKYGELYMWAKLMPYIQGVTLYFLCGAYPFACLLMIIPGWHKAFISWMLFYGWAKSWDAGFAVVEGLERNIWGMLGSSGDSSTKNKLIDGMREWAQIRVVGIKCEQQAGHDIGDLYGENNLVGCSEVRVESVRGNSSLSALQIFDRSIAMQYRLDFDVMNAYYVYLMSALFFAVPVVTGQLILAAKAGMANTLTQGISSSAAQAGSAAGQGYLGDLATQSANMREVAAQEAFAKALRDQGPDGKKESLASKIITTQNEAKKESMIASSFKAKKDQVAAYGGLAGTAIGSNRQLIHDSTGFLTKGGGGLVGILGKGKSLGGRFRSFISGGVGGGDAAIDAAYQIQETRVGMAATLAGARFGKMADIAGANSAYNSALGERYSQFADQQIGEAAWVTKRNMSNQIAGRMCAMGAFHGSFGAGPKPTNILGMIGSGMAYTFEQAPDVKMAAHNVDGYHQPIEGLWGIGGKFTTPAWRADDKDSWFLFGETGGMNSERIGLISKVNNLYETNAGLKRIYGYEDDSGDHSYEQTGKSVSKTTLEATTGGNPYDFDKVFSYK